jgi:hypothetical protein
MERDLYYVEDTYWLTINRGEKFSTFINFALKSYTFEYSRLFTNDKKIIFNEENVKIVFEKLLPKLKYDKEYNIKNWKNLYDIYLDNTI